MSRWGILNTWCLFYWFTRVTCCLSSVKSLSHTVVSWEINPYWCYKMHAEVDKGIIALCVSSGTCTLAQHPFQSFFTRSGRDSRLTDIRWDVKLLVDLGYMCAPERQPLPAGSDVAASGTMAPPVDVHICRTRAAATALSWDTLPARFHSLTAALWAACLAKVPYCTGAFLSLQPLSWILPQESHHPLHIWIGWKSGDQHYWGGCVNLTLFQVFKWQYSKWSKFLEILKRKSCIAFAAIVQYALDDFWPLEFKLRLLNATTSKSVCWTLLGFIPCVTFNIFVLLSIKTIMPFRFPITTLCFPSTIISWCTNGLLFLSFFLYIWYQHILLVFKYQGGMLLHSWCLHSKYWLVPSKIFYVILFLSLYSLFSSVMFCLDFFFLI